MMYWVLAVPYWIAMLAAIGTFVIVACGAHALVRHFVPYHDLVGHNDVAGFMIAVVGVLYAVLLAFIVVIVWQQYDTSLGRTEDEASAVAKVYDLMRVFPPEDRQTVRTLATTYAQEAIDQEWPAMKHGGESPALTATLDRLSVSVSEIIPHTPAQLFVRNQLIQYAGRIEDDRRQRLLDNQSGLPGVLWSALWIGAAITIAFGFLFGVKNFWIQMLMTAAVSALIAVSFVMISELDFPFRGDSGISDSLWQNLASLAGQPLTR